MHSICLVKEFVYLKYFNSRPNCVIIILPKNNFPFSRSPLLNKTSSLSLKIRISKQPSQKLYAFIQIDFRTRTSHIKQIKNFCNVHVTLPPIWPLSQMCNNYFIRLKLFWRCWIFQRENGSLNNFSLVVKVFLCTLKL